MLAMTDPTRKQRFRAALALAGLTQEQFAEQQGVTAHHFSQYMTGKRESGRLDELVDEFIARHLNAA